MYRPLTQDVIGEQEQDHEVNKPLALNMIGKEEKQEH